MDFDGARSSRFVELICPMKNLESLNLFENELTPDVLARVFQSCSKLTELNFTAFEFEMDGMGEDLKNQLRPGFQRLRFFELHGYIDPFSWPVIQEIFT